MATGFIPADTDLTNPHPRGKSSTLTRARSPQRAPTRARARGSRGNGLPAGIRQPQETDTIQYIVQNIKQY